MRLRKKRRRKKEQRTEGKKEEDARRTPKRNQVKLWRISNDYIVPVRPARRALLGGTAASIEMPITMALLLHDRPPRRPERPEPPTILLRLWLTFIFIFTFGQLHLLALHTHLHFPHSGAQLTSESDPLYDYPSQYYSSDHQHERAIRRQAAYSIVYMGVNFYTHESAFRANRILSLRFLRWAKSALAQ